MHISEYINVERLAEHLKSGIIRVSFHEYHPLAIYTYTKKALFGQVWDDVTRRIRGLIIDSHGQVIARPFEKFFDINTRSEDYTHTANLPISQPFVMEKMNGSLGIGYQYEGQQHISTKGSFHSPHAEWATQFYRKLNPTVGQHRALWPEGYTPVFEIINEDIEFHAVHYGEKKLVLLALINIKTGEEIDYNSLYYWSKINGLEVAPVYNKSVKDVMSEDRPNHEGYVLSWARPGQSPIRVRVKHPTYMTERKLVHACTPRAVYRAIRDGNQKQLGRMQNSVHPLLSQRATLITLALSIKYEQIRKTAAEILKQALVETTTRWELIQFLSTAERHPYMKAALAMQEQSNYKDAIFNMIDPVKAVKAAENNNAVPSNV